MKDYNAKNYILLLLMIGWSSLNTFCQEKPFHTDTDTFSILQVAQEGNTISGELSLDPSKYSSVTLLYPKVDFINLRFTLDDGIMQYFSPDAHVNVDDYHSSLLIAGVGNHKISIHFETKKDINEKSILFKIYEDKIDGDKAQNNNNVQYRNGCVCPPIEYVNRVGWDCPWGEDTTLFIPDYTKLTHIVVHHQGGNATPPYAATVRAIWNYHVNSNGWSDIGYHWLIAPDGEIFKGRAWLNGDQNIQGAHMCACNANKIGICLLGNLTNQGPTTEQYQSLVDLIAQKGCELDIQPNDASDVSARISGECRTELINHVIGHKDGCPSNYTACPGDAFAPSLPQLILDAQAKYDACEQTSTDDYLTTDDIQLYPNPSSGIFSINCQIPIKEVMIYDSKGNLVKSIQQSGYESITQFSIETVGIHLVRINDTYYKTVFVSK